jgi:cholest-4-en-3-one 26-monooxygenase
MVERLEAQAREWAIRIVESARERGTVNFVQEVAYQLPMHMIADIVGIPVDDRPWLFGLTNRLLAGTSAGADSSEEFLTVQVQMFEYAQQLGQRKRAEPQDDIWTILSNVEIETDAGERTGLSESELDLFFFLLVVAGSETTRSAITGGLIALLDHPDQMERLRQEGVTRPAVDEILRWSSPVAYFARRATRDTEIRGVNIAAGDRVTMWYPSANRDDAAFEDPFRFDTARTPNNHVAFGGGGPHHCLGANLARREISIMFEELLARTRQIEIIGPPTHSGLTIDSPVIGFVSELPVRIA